MVDASFISLKILMPVIRGWLCPQADIITLIKPQFEAGRDDVGKGGVVRDPEVHRRVLYEILTFVQQLDFTVKGLTTSPLKGPAGNIEFLAWYASGSRSEASLDIDVLVKSVVC